MKKPELDRWSRQFLTMMGGAAGLLAVPQGWLAIEAAAGKRPNNVSILADHATE
jgi:hypothetical protein